MGLLGGFLDGQGGRFPGFEAAADAADVGVAPCARGRRGSGRQRPQAIYAVFPYKGKNWLCKGGVMTYREHVTDQGRTLTDTEWDKMQPKLPQPAWTKGFCRPPTLDKK